MEETLVTCSNRCGGFDLGGDAFYFQQQWDKAQNFADDLVKVMKLLTKTAQTPVSTIKVPLKSSFVKKHDEEATTTVRGK